MPAREVRELSRWTTRHGALVRVCAGSIVDFCGDAVVNAANVGGLGGGGIDGAVNHAGGNELLTARYKLPQVEPGVRIPTGESRITVAGKLQVNFVIHSVGPCYPLSRDEDHREEDGQLRSAYVTALELAHKHKLRRVAFALISAGVFRGARSLQEILAVTCRAIDETARSGDDLSLCAYADEEQFILQEVAASVFIRDKRKMSRTGPAPSSPAQRAEDPSGELLRAPPKEEKPSAAASAGSSGSDAKSHHKVGASNNNNDNDNKNTNGARAPSASDIDAAKVVATRPPHPVPHPVQKAVSATTSTSVSGNPSEPGTQACKKP